MKTYGFEKSKFELAHSGAHSWHIRAHSGTFGAHSNLKHGNRFWRMYEKIGLREEAAQYVGTFAACTSPFYNNKRVATDHMQAKATDGHPIVTAVVVRVIEFYSPRVRKIGVQKLGGLSPLSVTDRGESLLIFGSMPRGFAKLWRTLTAAMRSGPSANVSRIALTS